MTREIASDAHRPRPGVLDQAIERIERRLTSSPIGEPDQHGRRQKRELGADAKQIGRVHAQHAQGRGRE